MLTKYQFYILKGVRSPQNITIDYYRQADVDSILAKNKKRYVKLKEKIKQLECAIEVKTIAMQTLERRLNEICQKQAHDYLQKREQSNATN